jgi:bifunctional non-homologous end joining protein LigD
MPYPRAKPPAGGIKANYPGFIEPSLATSIDKVPAGERWIHEIKFDGYRVQVHLRDAAVKVFTRRGNDWTNRFRKIAADAWNINAGSAIIDGEVVVPADDGTTDFSVLQNELKGRSNKIVMVAFDLLYLNGYDLRKLPLFERKALLKKIIDKTIFNSARASKSTVARCTSTPAKPALRASCRRFATAITSRVASTIG